MSTNGERVYGPYEDQSRPMPWRVVVIDSAGRRCVESFAREELAEEFRAAVIERASTRTVESGLDQYLHWLGKRDVAQASVDTTRWRLIGLHQPVLGSPLGSLTRHQTTDLYEQYTEGRAVDTHRNALGQAKTAAKWWVKQGWLKSSPWADVEPTGRRKRRKRQLRLDDTRKLLWVSLGLAARGDEGGLAVATMLLLGLRSSELCRISGEDFDCNSSVLLIPQAKSEAGVRELELPGVLQGRLSQLAQARSSLFPHRRWWVREQVQRLCGLAEVPPITAHALRGMHATIAVRRGVSAHAVAAALGHASPKVTADHYIAAGTTRLLMETL